MSNTPTSIKVALALGVLATAAGIGTLLTGGDDEAELAPVTVEDAAPAKSATRRTTSAGAWGLDDAGSVDGGVNADDRKPEIVDDDGGWGFDTQDRPPSRSSAPVGRSEDISPDPTMRPGPEVPNEAPGGAGERVEGMSNE